MKLQRLRGATSNLFDLFLQDSASTTGAGKTGLSSSSAGLIVAVKRELAAAYTVYAQASSNIETITTIGTFAAPSSSKCRFKEIDASNAAGMYQLMLADALFDASDASRFISGVIWGASGLAPCPFEIELQAVNVQDSVRYGLTALPNAAAEAAGGLYTRGSGAGQINQAANGMIDTNPVRLNNVAQSLLDLKDFADDGYDPATNKVQGVVLVDTLTTYTGNTPQTGDNFTRLGAPAGASVSADIAAVKAQTAAIEADTQDIQTRLPAALVGGRMDASVGVMQNNVITAAATAADYLTEMQALILSDATPFAGADIATILAAVASILADTNDIQTRLPAALVGGRMDSSVGAMANNVLTAAAIAANALAAAKFAADFYTAVQALILSDATPFAGANINATISSRATPAEVNAEVVDALATDTYAEPTGVPGNTVSLAEKIGRNYQALIKGTTVDSGTQKIGFKNAAGTIIWEKDYTDDGTVYDESAGNAP